MGMRHSTEIATSVMGRLLDFAAPVDVIIDFAADNVRFVGKTEDAVVAVFVEFAERCCRVGAQLNEVDAREVEEERKNGCDTSARKLVRQVYGFLGEQHNHDTMTMRSTERVTEKLQATWKRRGYWTNRQLAAHIGVLCHVSSTARPPLAKCFSVVRRFSGVMRKMQARPDLWDSMAEPLARCTVADLCAWAAAAFVNKPTPIPDYGEEECVHFICTDASSWGWAGIHVNAATGQTAMHAEPWGPHSNLNQAASMRAEPAASIRAAGVFLKGQVQGPVRFMTDHKALIYIGEQKRAICWDCNGLLLRLQRICNGANFHSQYVPGEANPADGPSRNVVDDISVEARGAAVKAPIVSQRCCARPEHIAFMMGTPLARA